MDELGWENLYIGYMDLKIKSVCDVRHKSGQLDIYSMWYETEQLFEDEGK